MTPIEEQEQRRPRERHERHFFIPAGVLMGLGIGLIAGYPGPGILIGLGLGFLIQALIRPVAGTSPDSAAPHSGHHNYISLLIGIFLVVIGISIIWSPVNLWPYIIGIFLILLGIVFAAKSLGKIR
jgi:hypothetical protein